MIQANVGLARLCIGLILFEGGRKGCRVASGDKMDMCIFRSHGEEITRIYDRFAECGGEDVVRER